MTAEEVIEWIEFEQSRELKDEDQSSEMSRQGGSFDRPTIFKSEFDYTDFESPTSTTRIYS